MAISVGIMMIASALAIGGQPGEKDVKLAQPAPRGSYVSHAPISINGNAAFASQAASEGWVGNGTQGNPYIISNYLIDGEDSSKFCIYIQDSNCFFIIKDCYLTNTDGATMSQPLLYIRPSGVALYNVTNAKVINNIANYNYNGFILISSNYNYLENNTALTNWYSGFNITENSCYNIITGNNASGSTWTYYGILFWEGYNNYNIISNNILHNTIWPTTIWIWSSFKNNIISNNTIIGGTIKFFGNWGEIENNLIINNSITSNWIPTFDYSHFNKLYHNSFYITSPPSDNTNDNFWNDSYPSGGNYWSKYTGIDVMSGPLQNIPGSDGIGDTPYIIDADSCDNYPLMSPWNGSASTSVSSSFKIPVVAGWNLISTPLISQYSSLYSAFNDKDSDTTWDRVQWYNSSTSTNPWKQYYSSWNSSLNDIAGANEKMGVWINVTNVGDGYLNVTGDVANSTSILLHTGWNLVGYPTLNSMMTVGDALWGTGATMVEVFDANSTYRTRVVGPTYVMKPGEGYWIYVPADTVWTVDW